MNEESKLSTKQNHLEWRRMYQLLHTRWWVVALVSLGFSLVALGASALQTPMYSSSSTLYVTAGSDPNAQSAYQGSLASQQRISSYAELVKSDRIVDKALRDTGLEMSREAAQASLATATTPDTVLLTISAEDESPRVAASLVNGVAQAMVDYVGDLERPSNGGEPVARLTIVSPAVENGIPVSPRLLRNSLVGLGAGLIAGVASVILWGRISRRVADGEDLENEVGRPVLASLPEDSTVSARHLVDFHDGGSSSAEGFRQLRSNLSFVAVDSPVRVLVVTSAVPGEGKSTVSANLACVLAETGHSVVLVDGDLRRPRLGKWLGVNSDVGLTTYLAGDHNVSDIVQLTKVRNLYFVSSGSAAPNPSELLNSERAKVVFAELAEKFEYVIVDSPPLGYVMDAAILSEIADGVLLVARMGVSKNSQVSAVIRQLDVARANVIGCVLNGVGNSKYEYLYRSYA